MTIDEEKLKAYLKELGVPYELINGIIARRCIMDASGMHYYPLEDNPKVHFTCTCCGRCCKTVHSSPKKVFKNTIDVLPDEVLRISDHLGMKPSNFVKKYTKMKTLYRGDETKLGVAFIPDPECRFLVDNKCSLHDIKPRSCKLYPIDVSTFSIARAVLCEGFDEGDFIDIDKAKRMMLEKIEADEAYFHGAPTSKTKIKKLYERLSTESNTYNSRNSSCCCRFGLTYFHGTKVFIMIEDRFSNWGTNFMDIGDVYFLS